jgi:mono/diheme cytochrome c family protein
MARTIKWILGGLAIVGGAAIACGIGFALIGISARREPPTIEVRLARTARHLLVPRAARARVNPVPATPEGLAGARAHFADHCATCHGNDGKGDTSYGRNLYPRAPDLTDAATQDLSDGELFYYIENGIKLTGMPAFGTGDPENEQQSWELVSFLRHLPKISPDELAAMERQNPRTREEIEAEIATEAFLRGDGEPVAPVPSHSEKNGH